MPEMFGKNRKKSQFAAAFLEEPILVELRKVAEQRKPDGSYPLGIKKKTKFLRNKLGCHIHDNPKQPELCAKLDEYINFYVRKIGSAPDPYLHAPCQIA